MAKSLTTITMDYNRAKQQANQLDEIADELRAISKNGIEQDSYELLSGWKGQSAQLFISKEQELAQSIAKTAKEVAVLAATIREAAHRTYQADKKAAEIAAKIGGSTIHISSNGTEHGGGGGYLGDL